jgi:hypothetical protein
MEQTPKPPTLPQSKSSQNIVLVWAISASAAAAFFALVALHFFVQTNRLQIPVSVTFRHAIADSSLVAQLHNNSGSTMKVLVVIEGQMGQSKQEELVLGTDDPVEIGWAQGWQFVSGEKIRIHNPQYRDLWFTAP